MFPLSGTTGYDVGGPDPRYRDRRSLDECVLAGPADGGHDRNMTTTQIALVTGANKGIGKQTATELADLGWTVWLGCRDTARGEAAVAELAAHGDVRFVQIDVTDDSSVAAAMTTIGDRLDVLVNNAGISGAQVGPVDTTPADFLPVFEVNLHGPVRVTNHALPLLRRSDQPRIVNVSSGLGSLRATTDPDRIEFTIDNLVYTSSKAALNMVTSQYSKALPDIQVNAVDPGYTATDLNGHSGPQTVAEGAAPVIAAATVRADGPTGAFFDGTGVVDW